MFVVVVVFVVLLLKRRIGNGMAEPIELKFSLNILPHPGFKVCDGEVDLSHRWPAVPRKRSENPDFRRFPPMINWWVDISLSFTRNNRYVLWQTLSPTFLTSTVRWNHGFGRLSGSDRPDPFLTVFTIFRSNPHRMLW